MISDILRIACIFTNVALIVVVTRANRSERRIVANLVERTERLRRRIDDGIPDNCEGIPCWTRTNSTRFTSQEKP